MTASQYRKSCVKLVAVLAALAALHPGCKKKEEAGPKEPPVAAEPRPECPDGMVAVPAGEFFMGCNQEVDESCTEAEKPGRKVQLDAFCIDRTEAAVDQYAACVKAGACSEEGLSKPSWKGQEQPEWAWACNWGKEGKEKHPINCIQWEQASAYCRWAGKRLPTEAEWEKAARGTDGRKYPWGNQEYAELGKAKRLVANVADQAEKRRDPKWTVAEGYDDGYAGTAPVGSFPQGASPYGALDMIGNVLEWVSDWHDPDYYKKAPQSNPKGPESGKHHVARGGGWYGEPVNTRISLRWLEPVRRIASVGMRCACDAKP
jgi:formylglycine-generating enzyme required for sulfatase activity